MKDPKEVAKELTQALRHGRTAEWQALRDFLQERQIAADRASVADMFSDDVNEEFAIVVTEDARVFTFSFRYGGEFHHEEEGGFPYTISRDQVKIVRWDELRTPAEQLVYKKKIDDALTVLDEERRDQ